MTDDPILDIENLTKSFDGLRALNALNAKIQRGAVVGIVGLNGSGKSVLLDVISGFTRPEAGRVQFRCRRGADPQTLSRRDAGAVARLGVARTFQRPIAPRMLTVKECLELALVGGEGADVPSVLRRFGLDKQQKLRVGELSGGMRKQVDLACALADHPVLALLDEPFCALAPEPRELLRQEIRALQRRGGTVVIVEHDIPEVLRWTEYVFRMDQGRVVEEGRPNEVLNEVVIASGLGSSGGARP